SAQGASGDRMKGSNNEMPSHLSVSRGAAMAFLNEYASDEDIRKYGLNGIWDRYHPAQKGGYYVGQRPGWTIDREKNVFFLPIPLLARDWDDLGEHRHLLWWNGAHVIAVVTLSERSSVKWTENPFRLIWKLVSLHLPEGFDVPREEVIRTLKDALTAHGYA